MALTMPDKKSDTADKTAWPSATAAEFERERRGGRYLHDGTTVENPCTPGETRHETYRPGRFKVHDLENTGGKEMVSMTIEFLTSANQPLAVPGRVRAAA